MKHEVFDKCLLEVFDSELNFESVYADECVPAENYNDITNADILLYPNKYIRENIPYCFPEQTVSFYNYLKEEADKKGIKVDICVSDENYLELELHADVVNIAHVVLTLAVLPIATKIIASYLYDLIKNRKTKLKANVKITVESNGKAKCIKYEGDAESFEKAMKSIEEHLFK